jgi:hypothetical protein
VNVTVIKFENGTTDFMKDSGTWEEEDFCDDDDDGEPDGNGVYALIGDELAANCIGLFSFGLPGTFFKINNPDIPLITNDFSRISYVTFKEHSEIFVHIDGISSTTVDSVAADDESLSDIDILSGVFACVDIDIYITSENTSSIVSIIFAEVFSYVLFL